jgi:hypothetical protein
MNLTGRSLFENCDPSKQAMLEEAFTAAWCILCPKQLKPGSKREDDLRGELARCIENLSSRNFKDSDELTKRCVEELLLGPRSLYRR